VASLKNMSINAKLSLLVAATVCAASLLACTAFMIDSNAMMRTNRVHELTSLAKVIGFGGTAALAADDATKAEEVLASLSQNPAIVFAVLYDRRGEVLATHGNTGHQDYRSQPPDKLGHRFTDEGHLGVYHLVVQNDEPVGTIYIHSNMADLHNRLSGQFQLLAIVTALSLVVATVLARYLQHRISQPILQLAETAQRITAEQDLSIRIENDGDDELGVLYDSFGRMLDEIQRGQHRVRQATDELERRMDERTRQLSQANLDLSREASGRTRAETELKSVHGKLVVAARKAGMAEIATGVLHNVGNVLNSVNVSAAMVGDQLRQSRVIDLRRAVQLIQEHGDDLGRFITQDEKGKQLPEFLSLLAAHLQRERDAMLDELNALSKNIDHVKTIVAMQQSYAKMAGVVQTVRVPELIEDALRLNAISFQQYGIQIEREYSEMPEVTVDKQKLLQIIINLVNNARDAQQSKDALAITDPAEKVVRVFCGTSPDDPDVARIEVTDNGVGTAREDLTRIFSHGFTTKKTGHGFGLHSSVLAAEAMDGSLTARSEGVGKGATFTVQFPLQAAIATSKKS
jgi:two-component system NtrC family sensor kinase